MRRLICVFVVRIWQKHEAAQLRNSMSGKPRGQLLYTYPADGHKAILNNVNNKSKTFEPRHDKTNSDCAPSEDSDQSGHSPSLIRVFAIRMKKAWVLSYPLSAQRRLWADWADAQADLSLRWAHMPLCWFCHEADLFQKADEFWRTLTCNKLGGRGGGGRLNRFDLITILALGSAVVHKQISYSVRMNDF